MTTTFAGNTSIRVDPRFFIAVTMNPGYAGRSRLPQSLRAEFRQITMPRPSMVPIIAED